MSHFQVCHKPMLTCSPLAKPMVFMPRSTIRFEIEEISEGEIYGRDDAVTKQRIGAELFIVLHGYKMLGYGTGLP